MNILQLTHLTATQKHAILRLWNSQYPAQLAYTGIDGLDSYLANLHNPAHYFATDHNGNIQGWAVTFERDEEQWFAIIVSDTTQRKGIGTQLLHKLKERATTLNGWVTHHNNYTRQDGTPYPSPLTFYQKNGFTICPDIELHTENLSAIKITWKRPALSSHQVTQTLSIP